MNVIYMYTSNLSRMFLISWTNDMLGAYNNSFILPKRTNVSYSNECIHRTNMEFTLQFVRTSTDFQWGKKSNERILKIWIQKSKFLSSKYMFQYLFEINQTQLDCFGQNRMEIVLWSKIGHISDAYVHSVHSSWFNSRDTVSKSKCLSLYTLHQYFQHTHTHTCDAYRASRTEHAFEINWYWKSFSLQYFYLSWILCVCGCWPLSALRCERRHNLVMILFGLLPSEESCFNSIGLYTIFFCTRYTEWGDTECVSATHIFFIFSYYV